MERAKKTIKSHWNEIWVKVSFKYPTKTCDYEVSNYGRVKSTHKNTGTENILKGSMSAQGFRQVNIRLTEGRHGCIFPHRVVAENFVARDNLELDYIWHLDKDKTNNYYENLEWISKEEWMARLIEKGSYSALHENRYKTYKLNETKVAIIKKLLLTGKTRRKMIAKRFGVTTTQLKRIERGENWGHVKPMD